jgi:flagellar basal body-associated protein FliL
VSRDKHGSRRRGQEVIAIFAKFKAFAKDHSASLQISTLIGVVILIVVAALIFPLVSTQVADLTDETSKNYVGSTTAPLVSMIPVFYWLAVALAVIGIAIATIRGSMKG